MATLYEIRKINEDMIEEVIEDGLQLLARLRRFRVEIETDEPNAAIDKMMADLKGNLFIEEDNPNPAIHDLIWNLGATRTIEILDRFCCVLIAKVTLCLLLDTYVDVALLQDHSAYDPPEKS